MPPPNNTLPPASSRFPKPRPAPRCIFLKIVCRQLTPFGAQLYLGSLFNPKPPAIPQEPPLTPLLSIFCGQPLQNLYFAAVSSPHLADTKELSARIQGGGEGGSKRQYGFVTKASLGGGGPRVLRPFCWMAESVPCQDLLKMRPFPNSACDLGGGQVEAGCGRRMMSSICGLRISAGT